MLHILDRVLHLFWFVLLGLTILAAACIGYSLVSANTPVDVVFLQSPISVEAFKDITGAEDIALNKTDRVAIEAVAFTSSDPGIAWLMAALIGLGTALFLYGYRLLQRVVSSAIHDDPFSSGNVIRIRKLASVALGLFVLRSCAPFISAAVAAMRLRGEAFHATFSMEADLAGLIIVLVLFALAEVFARGVELREENELTI